MTVDQLSHLLVVVMTSVFVFAFCGGVVGVVITRAGYDFLFTFIRRSPRWRRFDRAMRRRFGA